MAFDLHSLQETVQKNCHISDAHHAGDFTLCIYLLKMREYYRWEKGYGFGDALPGDDVGQWLTARERLWETLEDHSFEPVPVAGARFDPFDIDAINEALGTHGLVYSGGLGQRGRPHFFLGELERDERHDGFHVYVSSREYARDMTAPPAMAREGRIFVRRESLRRIIWEKVEEWRWHRHQNAMARAMAFYDFDTDVSAALEAMTDHELDSALLHEMGEVRAGDQLGEAWQELLAALPRSRAELMARAVRDHLADCLVTLPTMLDQANEASLHFYMANLNGMRRELFPSLTDAYQRWVEGESLQALRHAASLGTTHWAELAQSMLGHFRDGHDLAQLETLIDQHRL